MQTLQTTPHNMPIDRPVDRDKPIQGEPVRRTWLHMAKVNFPGSPIAKPNMLFSCRFLQRAVEAGHALALNLDIHHEGFADRIIDGPKNARRLRLYLAAVEGELDDVGDLDSAEFILGVKNADGTIKEEWK